MNRLKSIAVSKVCLFFWNAPLSHCTIFSEQSLLLSWTQLSSLLLGAQAMQTFNRLQWHCAQRTGCNLNCLITWVYLERNKGSVAFDEREAWIKWWCCLSMNSLCALNSSAIRQWDKSVPVQRTTEHVFSISRLQLVCVCLQSYQWSSQLASVPSGWHMVPTQGSCITASADVCSFCLCSHSLFHCIAVAVEEGHTFSFPPGLPVDFQLFVRHRGLCLQSNWLCQIFTYEHIATLEGMYHCE